MRILGIETSCDETAAAVVDDGIHVRSNVIASSQAVFEKSGGVIPEDAARRQLESMLPVIEQSLEGIGKESIDAIAVTKGPGLLGSLLIGTTTARTLSALWNVPLIGVHHTMGHLSSTFLGSDGTIAFPILTLSVSGGHSDLWLRESHTKGTLISTTRDDAAGEAFDKGAQLLGLPYPGGPALAALATGGNDAAFDFPLPLRGEDTTDWSFSGLKTALKYLLRDQPDANRADVAASFEHAICRHLCVRVLDAMDRFPEVSELHIVGGVSANTHLREMIRAAALPSVNVRTPINPLYCTDNAAMIASAGYFIAQEQKETAYEPFETKANLSLV